jgi:DNA ligase-1
MLKPIPNDFVQACIKGFPDNLDGELMLRSGDFNSVQSAIMSKEGEPDFVYHAFDMFGSPAVPYVYRLAELENLNFQHERFAMVETVVVATEQHLYELHNAYTKQGYEGLMYRRPASPYKHGRSTPREAYLVKLKSFCDAEGTLVELLEKQHNTNAAEVDMLGNTKRTSHKAGMVPAGTAGTAVIRWNGLEFKVGFGPGITDEVKQQWWDRRHELVGRTVTFSYQELSKYGVPRFGKLLGFRLDLGVP